MRNTVKIRGVWYNLNTLTEKRLKSLNLTDKERKEAGLPILKEVAKVVNYNQKTEKKEGV